MTAERRDELQLVKNMVIDGGVFIRKEETV